MEDEQLLSFHLIEANPSVCAPLSPCQIKLAGCGSGAPRLFSFLSSPASVHCDGVYLWQGRKEAGY